MSVINIIGWGAGALVLSTFYVRTMIPLRCLAIASNVTFITYGLLAELPPIFVLHGLLLPLNILRLRQMLSLIARVKSASCGDLSLEMLVPYMVRRTFPVGTKLFSKGDHADELFLILKGCVRVIECNVTLHTGELLGEMGLFAPGQKRTESAVCDSEVEIASITERNLWGIFYQNPEFGAYLLRIIVQRTKSAIYLT